MENLKANIKEAYERIEEMENRKKTFIEKYIETGDTLYYDLMEDESNNILRLVKAIRAAKGKTVIEEYR